MDKYILCLSVFLFSVIFTVIIEAILIPLLAKKAKQPIYEGGPVWHLNKSGTPTMGGIAFVLSISLSTILVAFLLIANGRSRFGISILITALFAIGNALVGLFDDMMKLYKKENAGLTPLQKLGLQLILSILFLMARARFSGDGSSVDFGLVNVDFGIFYYPLAIVILLGIINCANLTDGIDGLASSVAAVIGLAFLLIGFASSYDTPIISSALVGGSCGFLFFNSHPAKIFMGDTGSLFLGAIAAGLAFSMNNPLLIIPIGIVYVIEGASVILQVAVYKLTGKRLFKMAPLHHHLEKCGYGENSICIIAVILTLILSAATLLLMRN